MAITHLSSHEKWHVYHTLAQINRAFRALHFHLRNMEQARPFHTLRLREYQGFSKELQAQINGELLEELCKLEDHDSFRYGQIRAAREKYLKGE